MITGPLKSRIDSLWTDFWTGGITNPLTVIEQITFLMYSRLLDMKERADEKRASLTGNPFTRRFGDDEQDCRWETWRHYGSEKMLPHVRDRVFPHFRRLAERSTGTNSMFASFMKDAQLMIQKPTLLSKAVAAVGDLPLERGDTKGDLYEYLLSKLTTAGINGQFRTPRHIIRLIVELMQPQPTDRICDPACGTAGFLVEAYDYLLREHTSEAGKHVELVDGEEHVTYSGDLLSQQGHRAHVDSDMFHAYDFDATMLRIASMNLVMHGVAEPDVHYQDTLSQSFEERHSKGSKNAFDLILANPPFKGSLDEQDVAPDILRIVKTKKTELLFIGLILRMLKLGGRSATIVPDGVLFGSSKAHVQLRQHLIENNQLEAVISLPSGVFKPYAGVSTAVIIFAKGGKTENVFFYDMQSDGFTLDDKRTKIGDGKGDLPDVQAKYLQWCAGKGEFSDRTAKAFEVAADDIRAQGYDLSINRYKKRLQVSIDYETPSHLLQQLHTLGSEIHTNLQQLESLSPQIAQGKGGARWQKKPLIEVAKLQRGFDLPVQDRSEGPIPIFAANGQIGTHSEAMCKGPGVVTGRSGTIGKVHFVEGDYWPLNTSLFVVDFCGNHPKWVYYLLRAFRLERFSQGAGVPTLNRNLVHVELVEVPSPDEQQRIVDILDKVDCLRRMHLLAANKLVNLSAVLSARDFD